MYASANGSQEHVRLSMLPSKTEPANVRIGVFLAQDNEGRGEAIQTNSETCLQGHGERSE